MQSKPFTLVSIAAFVALTSAAYAESFIERSAEQRFQLDFHVPDAALQKMLPQGWVPAVATAGPAKDANLRVIFIDRIGAVGADGKSTGRPTQLVYVAIPVKQTGGSETGQMIIAGVTRDASDAPGAFGVLERANATSVQRSVGSSNAATIVEENWQFAAAGGEHLQIHVKYQRGPITKGGGEVKFFDPADPRKYQIFKTEQGLDITRNATTNPPDHVMEFSYSVGGGKLAPLFDGTEKVLSWDSFPWYDRTVLSP